MRSVVIDAPGQIRIDHRPDPVLLGGVVTAIDGLDLRLNSATGTVVRAPGLTGVAVDDVVRVWAARAALRLALVAKRGSLASAGRSRRRSRSIRKR